MNELQIKTNNNVPVTANEKVMTTKELAEQLKTDKKVVIENARKFLPNKVFEQGKTTYWSKSEVTILFEGMKGNNSNQYREKGTVTGAVTVASTDLTPALKIRNAMLMMQEAYEEELNNIKAKYLEEKAVNDRISNGKGCYGMNQTAKALKLPYGDKTLYKELVRMGILNEDHSPRQEQINAERFKVVVKFINDFVGSKPVTLTTGKGLVYLAKKFNTTIDEAILPDNN